MSNIPFNIKKGLRENLDSLSIVNGTIYYCIDTKEIFIDMENERVPLTKDNLENVLLYAEQDLTEEEIVQVRKNLGLYYIEQEEILSLSKSQLENYDLFLDIKKWYNDNVRFEFIATTASGENVIIKHENMFIEFIEYFSVPPTAVGFTIDLVGGSDYGRTGFVVFDGAAVQGYFPDPYVPITKYDGTQIRDLGASAYYADYTLKIYKLVGKNKISNELLDLEKIVGQLYNQRTEHGEIFNDYENNIASGDYSHAEGLGTEAGGTGSHSEGIRTIAIASNNDYNGAYASHAEGYETQALGSASHAEGYQTVASEDYSHAEGYNTKASAKASHAEGYNTKASGYYSHAEGYDSQANGDYSHAEGYNSEANGNYSHAEGYNTTVAGKYSHAEGYNTIASSEYQHVQGKFNIKDTENQYAHIVGNGTEGMPSNAYTLDWNGNLWLAGNIYAGGTGMDTAIKVSKGPRLTKIILQVANWNANTLTQEVEIKGILADETKQIIQVNPVTNNKNNVIEIDNCEIAPLEQQENKLIFICEQIPAIDIEFYVSYQDALWIDEPIDHLLTDFNYIYDGDADLYHLVSWKGTTNGSISSYEMIIPDNPKIII